MLEFADGCGVRPVWERLCVPLLTGLPGRDAAGIAVEHALSERIRISLDVYRRDPGRRFPADGVLLAGAEHEAHCLGLHAVAAALRERGRGCVHLGPALPWAALHRPWCGPARVPSWSGRRPRSPPARTAWSTLAATSRRYGCTPPARAGSSPCVDDALPADTFAAALTACGVRLADRLTPCGVDSEPHHIRYDPVPYRNPRGRTVSRVTSLPRFVFHARG